MELTVATAATEFFILFFFCVNTALIKFKIAFHRSHSVILISIKSIIVHSPNYIFFSLAGPNESRTSTWYDTHEHTRAPMNENKKSKNIASVSFISHQSIRNKRARNSAATRTTCTNSLPPHRIQSHSDLRRHTLNSQFHLTYGARFTLIPFANPAYIDTLFRNNSLLSEISVWIWSSIGIPHAVH